MNPPSGKAWISPRREECALVTKESGLVQSRPQAGTNLRGRWVRPLCCSASEGRGRRPCLCSPGNTWSAQGSPSRPLLDKGRLTLLSPLSPLAPHHQAQARSAASRPATTTESHRASTTRPPGGRQHFNTTVYVDFDYKVVLHLKCAEQQPEPESSSIDQEDLSGQPSSSRPSLSHCPAPAPGPRGR